MASAAINLASLNFYFFTHQTGAFDSPTRPGTLVEWADPYTWHKFTNSIGAVAYFFVPAQIITGLIAILLSLWMPRNSKTICLSSGVIFLLAVHPLMFVLWAASTAEGLRLDYAYYVFWRGLLGSWILWLAFLPSSVTSGWMYWRLALRRTEVAAS